MTETTLTPATAGKVRFLRSIVAPPVGNGCADDTIQAPVLTGGDL